MCLAQMSVAGLIREIGKERTLLVQHTEKLQAIYEELVPYQYMLTQSEVVVHENLNDQLEQLYEALGLDT